MLIDNEFLNRLLRAGEGLATLSSSPRIDELIDPDGRFLQPSGRVPLLDALRAVVHCAARTDAGHVHPGDSTVIAVDKHCLEQLIVSLVRLERKQGNLLEPKPLAEQTKDEVKTAEACYGVAQQIAAAIVKRPRLPMEDFVNLIAESPEPALTGNFLVNAGPEQPGFVGPNGPMPRLKADPPATLPAGKPVNVKVRVWCVKDREGVARVEILGYLDSRSEGVLVHHATEIALRFDKDTLEREDLMAAQYLKAPIRIRAAAECAVHPRYASKTSLSLIRVRESRTVMDKLHATARQLEFRFDAQEEQGVSVENELAENADAA